MSNRVIVVSLLMMLISACASQLSILTPPAEEDQNALPVLLNTVESIPEATPTPLIVMATAQEVSPTVPYIDTVTTPQVCPGAPVPHVEIGQQVTVLVENFDKLKLRSAPEISLDTEKMELDKFAQLKILEGPVCVVDAETEVFYWFWKVGVPPGTEIGWVAEGDSLHYFIE